MPGKRASVKAMQAAFTNTMKEECGKGSILVPVVRIETHFGKDRVDDMVESNLMRLLVCSDGYGCGTSVFTSAIPVPVGEKKLRTWYCQYRWTPTELEEAYLDTGILSLLKADPEDSDVFYIPFYSDDMQHQVNVIDETTKRLVRSITADDYNLAGACTTACNDKAFVLAHNRKEQLEKVFGRHMHDELLPYFRRLLSVDTGRETRCDTLDPMAKDANIVKDSASTFIAYCKTGC